VAVINKKIIRKIFRKVFGFHLSRTRTTMGEALEFVKSQGIVPNTIFDIGVANGTFDLYEVFPNTKIVLVEPLEEYSKYMASLSNQYDVEIVKAAASNINGLIEINVHEDLVGSTLLREKEGEKVDGVKRMVSSIRIDQLAERKNYRPPFLVKADVQGAELLVVEGMEGILQNIEVIILETSLFGFFIDGPQFYDVISFMKKKGFVVYDIFDGRNRLIDDALAQVDVMFVKEYGMLRSSHSFADIEQRRKQNEILLKNVIR